MAMTPEAKKELGKTIRGLREYLLERLSDAVRAAYQLDIVRLNDTNLDHLRRVRRQRLERHLDEQSLRNKDERPRALADLVKQAAYTLLNRLVFLRLLEAAGLRPKLVTGGWASTVYMDFRKLAPVLTQNLERDPSEGMSLLLDLTYRELAVDLPGLFGRGAGAVELVPTPAHVLKEVLSRLDEGALASCWTDDMTLGWVYQYWNDPEREELDKKLNARGKLESWEIASKTQMFTERYMVDWLLQNSLGPMWLAMCQKHGWVPECESSGVLARLESRRVEWRRKRDAGEVALTELMPLDGDDEARWAYYVPQAIPPDAVAHAPDSVRDIKLLDPAVGSGHFLVVAFDLLVALYREEARHRGETGDERWSDQAIVERILEANLHGIDLDPRAVQIAAAALWLKARQTAKDARPKAVNLVSSNLQLGNLKSDDPALVELRAAIASETGIPAELTDTIVQSLKGADWLGSLLKVDDAVDEAIAEHDNQRTVFSAWSSRAWDSLSSRRESVLEKLSTFLTTKTGGDDLGLRLRGAQLASGVRFLRMIREGQYDLVVGNPPYQGTTKMRDAAYLQKHYPRGKADLYAMFLERCPQLVREGGTSALLTMRGWMFLKQYSELRQQLLRAYDLRAIADFAEGAFEEVGGFVVSVSIAVFRHASNISRSTTALRLVEAEGGVERTQRKRAGTLAHVGRYEFLAADLRVVPESPLVYWWHTDLLAAYSSARKLGEFGPIRYGLSTQNNVRWIRNPWEVLRSRTMIRTFEGKHTWDGSDWVPYIKGSAGRKWFDVVSDVVLWRLAGCEHWAYPDNRWGRGTDYYFERGVAFVNVGAEFSARVHRVPSIFGHVAGSVFGLNPASTLCLLNSTRARHIMESLNPGLHFLTSDVERLPVFDIAQADDILAALDEAFTEHESHREPSVEFRAPGPSPWRHAQDWAQLAVDREPDAPLPPYTAVHDPEPPTDHVSFALGVALGRFGPHGEGILDPHTSDLTHALPHGLLFLDGTLTASQRDDGLGHPAAAPLIAAWETYGAQIKAKKSLRDYLQDDFFATHKAMYDNRPIHWPLSSEKKTFVVWMNIHRMHEGTLNDLLATHLVPRQRALHGVLGDLIQARATTDKAKVRAAEDTYAKLAKAKTELDTFIEQVRQCATFGPPPPDPKTPPREVDARYAPDLDDGVMINSAALWPLLEPQWKDPKKWWKELASAAGKKDYDWSHLAMRYWPTRVDQKCQTDPSLGVAHGCFWTYHPERAYAWELRLQDEIGPDFRITEPPYRDRTPDGDATLRRAFIAEHPDQALAAITKEAQRRRRKQKAPIPSITLLAPGLWTTVPHQVWALELDLTEKQGAEFRLLSPDEPTARTTFEAQHPTLLADRNRLVATLQPAPLLDLEGPPDNLDAEPTDPDEDE